MPSPLDWLESLSPWPEEFGLEPMHALLDELGEPQRAFRSIHVVGTNGKSTATRRAAAFLLREGLSVGAYTSPHVAGWSERIQVDGDDADLEQALERVRPAAERTGATQFEVLTAAALAEFAAAGVEAAVVEAGLGGRLDATNVLNAEVVALTNVALDHTDVLGETREAIAAEKLAVVQPGCTVVLGEPEWRELAEENGASAVVVTGRSNLALAIAAAESFLGRPVDPHAADDVVLPGRLERRGDDPLEIWDGAHNLAGIGWLLPRLPAAPAGGWVVVCSILRDKRPGMMLEALSVLGPALVALQDPRLGLRGDDVFDRDRDARTRCPVEAGCLERVKGRCHSHLGVALGKVVDDGRQSLLVDAVVDVAVVDRECLVEQRPTKGRLDRHGLTRLPVLRNFHSR
jgi:dihydrofolate synthase/folylpolyglutamate synthase